MQQSITFPSEENTLSNRLFLLLCTRGISKTGRFLPVIFVALFSLKATAQSPSVLAFVSDTQAPLWVETIILRPHHNEKATQLIMGDIAREKPTALFILGDVTSLSYKNKKWACMDQYLSPFRVAVIPVHALLGNHDVMGCSKKGEAQFQKRFPQHVRTGYIEIVDSIAVLLLNSNFNKLSNAAIQAQQRWLNTTLKELDERKDVTAVIITCHHAPYTNSKIVGSSKRVQQHFVIPFLQSKKCRLFITGHAHAFEHFQKEGKDFLTIGGGGGLHQPLRTTTDKIEDLASDYKPMFHYLNVQRGKQALLVTSYFVNDGVTGIEKGTSFTIALP